MLSHNEFLKPRLMFFNDFITKPRQTGAICASSPALAQKMVEGIAWESSQNIVEIGPGTGAFTSEILKKKHKNAPFVAIEINPKMVEILHKKFPKLTVENDNAENLSAILAKYAMNFCDVIISGIPWTVLPEPAQDALLAAIAQNLKADSGTFATFMYALPTLRKKKFVKKLHRYFSKVRVSDVVWRNIPPAFVCYCQK